MSDAAFLGVGALRASEWETIMKRLRTVLSVVSLVASTCAFAQTNSTGGKPADGGGQQAQPGAASRSMDHAAASGDKAASGTLMQQRQKGMSPEGASGGEATGKMKQ